LNKTVIAFDESTKSTGYAIFKNSELIDYGVIEQNSKNVLERVNNIINEINILIEKYKPNDIALENIQITLSAPTAKSLMGLQFLIELLCFQKNIKCTTIRPTHWRKVLGLSNSSKLNRKEKKEATITYVKEKYKINEDIDDICDAICIGECYIKEEAK
jgi:Holliday junction resolvasome RuvABC endonuclease subunit